MFLRKNMGRYCKYFSGPILYPVQGRCKKDVLNMQVEETKCEREGLPNKGR